ncbi:LpqB family beta-propeller domain-containing protein [Streptomyces sp. NBC_01142]|uniref:LpqB family beta-propeller domain-containing protein n=1 Tax=Streptomyces sp. NBC_01142 TaxID=2975865 RepID=UPI0022593BB7|nr:LpqB family beta-propeller domain-containing protein [Streptomyces sp. NBC_01142]MCX4823507.1 LpqB family beta-propeller domain-containing protein [Streptomyces sp. NBC_01142]
MPDSGDIHAVKASPRADSQVRVYAVPPRKGAPPHEIVEGFLEAMTSDDSDFATARTYLTPETSKKWRPEASTTVLSAAPNSGQAVSGDRDNPGWDYPLLGKQVATVDSQHAYQPVTPTDYHRNIHLVQQNGPDGKEWRIDSLPPGLVLGASDFQRNYRSVNKYYFASGRNVVVADPVYIRQRLDPVTRMDPVTQSVKALLEGPTNWLKPVVESPFPTGTTLKEGTKTLAFDDRNALKVPLNDKASNVGRPQCMKMAAQILFTVKDVTSTRVEQVELQRKDGSQLCVLNGGQAEEFAPDRSGRPEYQYFVDSKNQLALLVGAAKDIDEPENVPGPFGNGRLPVSAAGVARDERTAAAVSKDADRLFVASIISDSELGDPVLRSRGKDRASRLSAPSWDGQGDLWVADRDPAHPALLRLEDGVGTPQDVKIIPGLDGARIEALRVSADGVRIALLLTKDGRTTLKIGRVERHGPKDDPVVSVAELRPAAPQMETVTAVSWAGPSRLVVVGKESGGVQQVRYMQTDGSSSAASILPGLNQVRAVAAADDETRPLVAYSEEDGIVRLPPGANWQTLVKKGSSPVYPG